MSTPHLQSLHIYPLKSARGFEHAQAVATRRGLDGDRSFMLVTPEGRFLTQREHPRMALLVPHIDAMSFTLEAPGRTPLRLDLGSSFAPCNVRIWDDECAAFDLGRSAAAWLSEYLNSPCRLVRFDDARQRLSSAQWCQGIEAPNHFSDGFPYLVIGSASLEDLNRRLPAPLPMNRFRPNLVIEGWEPYAEDRVDELQIGAVRLKLVKPCARCRITATEQSSGVFQGDEPLRTLKQYRMDHALHGVLFGQNAIMIEGDGQLLERGAEVSVRWKSGL